MSRSTFGTWSVAHVLNWKVTVRPSLLDVWMPLVTVYFGVTSARVSAVALWEGSPAAVMVAELVEVVPLGVAKLGYAIDTVMVAVVPGLRSLSLMFIAPPIAPSTGTVEAASSTVVGSGVQPTNCMFDGRASAICPAVHSVAEHVYLRV